jgi:carbamoyltransferase
MTRVAGRPGRAVMGIGAFTHDSSAALIVNGALVGFVEEERLSGEKHTGAYPEAAVEWLLARAGLTSREIDVVAYPFNARLFARGALRAASRPTAISWRRYGARVASYRRVWRNCRRRLAVLASRFPSARIVDVPHHLCHAMNAFSSASVEHGVVLTIDSIGEDVSTTIIEMTQTHHRVLLQVRDPHSLGYAYGAVTEHLGYRRGDEEGTVMALAGLGDERRYAPLLSEAIRLTASGFKLNPAVFAPRVFSSAWPRLTELFVDATFPRRAGGEPVGSPHADLAAALQTRTEDCVLHLGRLARRASTSDVLCVSGGVGMNCLATGVLARSGLFGRVTVPPAPGDSGNALGAALWIERELGEVPVSGIDGTPFMGPDFDRREMLEVAEARGFRVEVIDDAAECVAGLMLDQQIVGVFRGRLEAGPRALGHRSILANPLMPDVTAHLNARVKHRELFRPFAPVVTADAAHRFFELEDESPFMSFAMPATAAAIEALPAVVHANGTARLQTVTPASDAFLHEVLVRFGHASGYPVLINTSLNVKGKPIAGTPGMALDCLVEAELDALLMDDVLVRP